jgi:Tfp pilus assembly protein PilO
MMGAKLSISLLGIIAIIGVAFAWYFNNTQAKMAILIENAATLESVTKSQKVAIENLEADVKKQAALSQELNLQLQQSESNNKKIATMLAETDIVKNSLLDPKAVEQRINEEINIYFNSLQSLTTD